MFNPFKLLVSLFLIPAYILAYYGEKVDGERVTVAKALKLWRIVEIELVR